MDGELDEQAEIISQSDHQAIDDPFLIRHLRSCAESFGSSRVSILTVES